MQKIGVEQFSEAYKYAKLVRSKSVSLKVAVSDIEKNAGMTSSSASGYIRVFLRMMDGRIYERTINPEATDYYLTNIYHDFGSLHLRNALSAVDQYLQYYEKKSKNSSKQPKVHVIYLKHLGALDKLGSDIDNYEKFEHEIAKSLKDDSQIRRARLLEAQAIPITKQVSATVFIRNPDVVAEVLLRAAGRCERCKKEAPFVRASNHTPYLEVHHTIPLSKHGEDTVQNAVALCPNRHRELHYGIST